MDTISLILMCVWSLLLSEVKSNRNFPIGHPQACGIDEKRQYIFEVLPGLGWDNLANKIRGPIINFNYSTCKTTSDQRYLIPDGIVTLPIKSSRMNVFSTMYDSWSEYKSDTSFSINVGGSASDEGVKIAGSFSSEFQHVKSKQIENKAFTTKVQVTYVRYTAEVLSDAQLDSSFRSRLLAIANHLQRNRTLSVRYESELLVRDFGTHVITTTDAGASIVKVDQVKSSIKNDETMSTLNISLAASLSFPILADFKISSKFAIDDKSLDTYRSYLTDSNIRTYGGPALNPENFTLGKWVSEINEDLVSVDRNGFPLDHFVTKTTLPELSDILVYELSKSISTAITNYYRHNTYHGCTNTDAPNFSHNANVDDGTCHVPLTNFSFGGVFQECDYNGDLIDEDLCGQFGTKNPITGSYSCPNGYEKTLLYTNYTEKLQYKHVCEDCDFFCTCCSDIQYYGKATFTTFWCQAANKSPLPQDSGYLFGGLYTDRTNNLVTNSKSCPPFYLPLTITSNVFVCVSDDYEQGEKFSVPFGGFYSCMYGNSIPTVNTVNEKSKTCPHGYSNHLATIYNHCEIMYCIRTGALSDLKFPHLQLPPFTMIPEESIKPLEKCIISNDGQSWMQLIKPATTNHKLDKNKLTTLQTAQIEMNNLIEKFSGKHFNFPKDEGISKAAVVGFSIGLITLVCLIVGLVVLIL